MLCYEQWALPYIILSEYTKKNSLFLYLKWWAAQQDFSQLLTNESVRATNTTDIKLFVPIDYL